MLKPLSIIRSLLLFMFLSASLVMTGCVGLVIDATTDAAIAVAKVPFKVGGAVVDVATGDDDDDEKD